MEALSLAWNCLHQISSGVCESGTNGLCAHVWMEPMNICRWVFMPDPLPVYLRGWQPTLSGSLSQDTIICTMCIMCHEIKRFRQPKQNSVLDAKVFVKILKAILGEREVCFMPSQQLRLYHCKETSPALLRQSCGPNYKQCCQTGINKQRCQTECSPQHKMKQCTGWHLDKSRRNKESP